MCGTKDNRFAPINGGRHRNEKFNSFTRKSWRSRSTGILAAGGIFSSFFLPPFHSQFFVRLDHISKATNEREKKIGVQLKCSRCSFCFRVFFFHFAASSQLRFSYVYCTAQTCRRDMRYVIPITCTNWKPLRLHSIKFTRNEWIATQSHLLKKKKKECMEKRERLWAKPKKRSGRKTREPKISRK